MISAVVLAAGAATRFGSPKQLLLLPVRARRPRAAPVDEVVVVAGAYPIEATRRSTSRARASSTCPDWALGPGASLRCGLAALGDDVEAALVVLADGPYLDPRAVERVLAHRDEADFVAASYDGDARPPGRDLARRLGEIPDDGGRGLEVLLVPCDDLTPPGDIDTPDLLPRDL